MNKHKSSKIKENSNTVRHLIIGQIITTQNLVATKVVRLAGQWDDVFALKCNCQIELTSQIFSKKRKQVLSFPVGECRRKLEKFDQRALMTSQNLALASFTNR